MSGRAMTTEDLEVSDSRRSLAKGLWPTVQMKCFTA
jgi:hypothetical protein